MSKLIYSTYNYSNVNRGGSREGRTRPKIGKNMIFWRKIVIFHTKYLKNFRASLRNWKIDINKNIQGIDNLVFLFSVVLNIL
jgi:hypothetical protein